jgi:hypothetical protein
MTRGRFLVWSALTLAAAVPGTVWGQPVVVKQRYVKVDDCSTPRALRIRLKITGTVEIAQARLLPDGLEISRAGADNHIAACFDVLSGDTTDGETAFVNLRIEPAVPKRVIVRTETPALGKPVLYIEPEP